MLHVTAWEDTVLVGKRGGYRKLLFGPQVRLTFLQL